MNLETVVAVMKPRSFTKPDLVCLAHGANSAVNADDHPMMLCECIDLAEGGGLKCDLCGAEIVAAGVPFTDEAFQTMCRVRGEIWEREGDALVFRGYAKEG